MVDANSHTGTKYNGTDSGSQPITTKAPRSPTRSRRARISELLPLPASPPTSASEPRPANASSNAEPSDASSSSRSNNRSTRPILDLPRRRVGFGGCGPSRSGHSADMHLMRQLSNPPPQLHVLLETRNDQ